MSGEKQVDTFINIIDIYEHLNYIIYIKVTRKEHLN